MKTLVNHKEYDAIEEKLSAEPRLANEGWALHDHTKTTAHPLHRICDGVFLKYYTDDEAVRMASVFLKHGASINGNEQIPGTDTPLIAAASLHADQVAMLYIEHGADIHHPGTHGGTALHWAAWCGRPVVVKRLLEAGAQVQVLCNDFKSTPLFWAVHGSKNHKGSPDHTRCVQLLLDAGSDSTLPNKDGKTVFDLLDGPDDPMRAVLQGN